VAALSDFSQLCRMFGQHKTANEAAVTSTSPDTPSAPRATRSRPSMLRVWALATSAWEGGDVNLRRVDESIDFGNHCGQKGSQLRRAHSSHGPENEIVLHDSTFSFLSQGRTVPALEWLVACATGETRLALPSCHSSVPSSSESNAGDSSPSSPNPSELHPSLQNNAPPHHNHSTQLLKQQ
jgi:hypothetical protein